MSETKRNQRKPNRVTGTRTGTEKCTGRMLYYLEYYPFMHLSRVNNNMRYCSNRKTTLGIVNYNQLKIYVLNSGGTRIRVWGRGAIKKVVK